MHSKKKSAMFILLGQRSTWAGLAGLIISALMAAGVDLGHGARDAISDIMLVVVSITAILTQPASDAHLYSQPPEPLEPPESDQDSEE